MFRRWNLLVGFLVLGLVAVAQGEDLKPGLLVRFYDVETEMRALPDLPDGQLPNETRVVPTLDLQLDRKDFGDRKENFLTEALGQLDLPRDGKYVFRLVSDDGAKLWIDGRLIVDHDGLHPPQPKDSAVVELAAGPHSLRVYHLQGGGGAQLTLQWQPQPDSQPATAPASLELLPASALRHAADLSTQTAPGKKKIIPALRRGRPGDGSPLDTTNPGFGALSFQIEEFQWEALEGGTLRATLREGEDRRPFIAGPAPFAIAWTGQPEKLAGLPIWLPPENCGVCAGPTAYVGAALIGSAATGELQRIFQDSPPNGCVYRFSGTGFRFDAILLAEDGTLLVSNMVERAKGKDVPTTVQTLTPLDKPAFEIMVVECLENGLQLHFSRPLDQRVGWDPDAYYIEQWPFSIQKGLAPRRDGVVYPVKSATVSPDRRSVYLETEPLKQSHVVYLRVLPPCLSEDGDQLFSTEAWYTLHQLPTGRFGVRGQPPERPPQNLLSDAEQRDGWRLLFDGQTTKGWHGYRQNSFPDGWKVIDGCLVRVGGGGDISTDDEFDSFELALEWRISSGGNSGIFFRSDEQYRYPWESAPEMQVLDNAEHPDGRDPKTSAGSNYALHAPVRDVTQPIGFFNQVRLIVRGQHVEHWLNGTRIVEYQLGSPEWQKLVSESKFKDMPHYGRSPKGHIVLQDHGDKVWYRNIKIRPLKPE